MAHSNIFKRSDSPFASDLATWRFPIAYEEMRL